MVEAPAVELCVRTAPSFVAIGPLADRAARSIRQAACRWGMSELPAVEICIERTAPHHVGLGVGTQLGLATVAALARYLDRPLPAATELALCAGRGARSAVGTHGFLSGGLIVDGGKQAADTLGRLERRVLVPDDWRIVLITIDDQRGISGERERDAFASLAPVPAATSARLRRIVAEEMLPGIEARDCLKFGAGLYRYGRMAGECFAAVQEGAFASREIAAHVAALRRFGIPGVGQSSWGPTVFAVVDRASEADRLVDWLCDRQRVPRHAITVTTANNCGARVACDDGGDASSSA